MVVVVAGDDHDLGAGRSAAASSCSTGPAALSASRTGPVAQLEDVTEQHEALDLGERVEQRVAAPAARRSRSPRLRAPEMQVGDDQRAQRAPLRSTSRRRPPAPGGSPWGA